MRQAFESRPPTLSGKGVSANVMRLARHYYTSLRYSP
jgi:hypothetical protein